nr:putative cyanate transporter [Klebsiella pneumoniae]
MTPALRQNLTLAVPVLTGINMRPLLTSIGPLLPDIRAASGMSYTLAALLTALPVIAMGCWRWPLAGSIAISVKSAVLR